MSTILLAIVSVTALGIICAIMLAVASKVMAVAEDERVAMIRECLSGVNCGACGFNGCDGYANALVESDVGVNLCIPGGDELSERLGLILGKAHSEGVTRRVSIVRCRGDADARKCKMDYDGIRTCAAVKQLFGGQNACSFGCYGFGDCAAVCPNTAICIENGLARVDVRKCAGCGLCGKVCPNDMLILKNSAAIASVLCRNTEKGAVVTKKCSYGCIACLKCVRVCPHEAITVSDNLACVEPAKCDGCGKCADVCVTGCIGV